MNPKASDQQALKEAAMRLVDATDRARKAVDGIDSSIAPFQRALCDAGMHDINSAEYVSNIRPIVMSRIQAARDALNAYIAAGALDDFRGHNPRANSYKPTIEVIARDAERLFAELPGAAN
jgi:hypothetical protein